MPLRKLYILSMLILTLIVCLCWVQLKLIRKNYEATSFYYHQQVKKIVSTFASPFFSESLDKLNTSLLSISKTYLKKRALLPKETVTKRYYNDSVAYTSVNDTTRLLERRAYVEKNIPLCRIPPGMRNQILRTFADSMNSILQAHYQGSLQTVFTKAMEGISGSESIYLCIDISYLAMRENGIEYVVTESSLPVYLVLTSPSPSGSETVFDSMRVNIQGRNFQMFLNTKVIWPNSHVFFLWQNKESIVLSVIITLLLIVLCCLALLFIAKQKKLERQKDDFINNVTHEFKTPIATLVIAGNSLLKAEIQQHPEEISYLAGVINRQTERLKYFFNEVLAASESKYAKEKDRVDIHEVLLQDIETIVLKYSEVTEATIEKQFTTECSVVALSRDELHTVFMNVLDNSFKYRNTTPLVIHVKTFSKAKKITVEISDNGKGITAEHLPFVFKKFYRGTLKKNAGIGGLGLGLYNASRIAEQNGFDIQIKSLYEKGTTVVIKF
jgi:signal transduction histidine kinase